jgi:hypothetical protein
MHGPINIRLYACIIASLFNEAVDVI